MRVAALPALFLATAALGGCGSTLPDSESLVVDVRVSTATAGGALPFTFSNESSERVTTGDLDCTVSYERREGSGWVRHEPLRTCALVAEFHPAGSSRSYQTTAPETGGVWRLVVEAWPEGVPTHTLVTTRSQSFMVLGAE